MPSLSAAMAAEAAKPFNEPFMLVHLDVLGDPLYGWTGQADRNFTIASDPLLISPGKTFLGLAAISSVSDVSHSADGTMTQITLVMGFADFTDPATFDFVNYVEQWSQRLGVVWLGYVNSATGAIIADPKRILTGRMKHVEINDGPEPAIAVKLVARAGADGQRASAWKLSDAHQQAFWPGDLALQFVPQMVGKELRFGTPDAVARGSTGGNGGAYRGPISDAIDRVLA